MEVTDPYEDIEILSGFEANDPDYLANIRSIMDSSYETEGYRRAGFARIGDDPISFYYTAAIRLTYSVNDNLH